MSSQNVLLTFQVTVEDFGGLKSTDTCLVNVVNVSNGNIPPEADAGPDQNAYTWNTVTLDGSNSFDPDDGIASVRWKQLSGTPVSLSDPSTLKVSFFVPDGMAEGEFMTFQITVTDNGGLASQDTCIITPVGTWNNNENVGLPTCPVTAPGGDDLRTRNNSGQHLVLNGDHGDYTFGGGNTVVFGTGVYSFLSLKFGTNTRIEIQAPVTIHIANALVFGNGVKQTLLSGEAHDVVYRMGSGSTAKTGKLNEIYGTFCGPDAAVTILSGTSFNGGVYSDTVTFGKNLTLIADPANAVDLE